MSEIKRDKELKKERMKESKKQKKIEKDDVVNQTYFSLRRNKVAICLEVIDGFEECG